MSFPPHPTKSMKEEFVEEGLRQLLSLGRQRKSGQPLLTNEVRALESAGARDFAEAHSLLLPRSNDCDGRT